MTSPVGYAGPVTWAVVDVVTGPAAFEVVEVETVVIAEEVEDAEEVEGAVEVEEPSLPETKPSITKYWAESSVAMMSSPKTQRQTTEPFLNWCVYAAMRFFESLMKTDAIEVRVMLVIVFSSCEA
jgi:hypothetical protein